MPRKKTFNLSECIAIEILFLKTKHVIHYNTMVAQL